MSEFGERNPGTEKPLLYRTREDQERDCATYPFEEIPARVFLDTNVVNALVKFSSTIFEQQSLPDGLHQTAARDVQALMHVFRIGSRAHWNLVASHKTLEEIDRTPVKPLRYILTDYAIQIVETGTPAARHANELARRITGSTFFNVLPDHADRELLAHAIGLNCDVFCTSDRSTIVRYRDRLPKLPLRIMTPIEWWHHIRPWAALWC
ncbi:hypothetical protein [Rhizorhabdus histidinilytica]|uniref:hypothetical protein n=1 Tax=Rhizorhabdus histidinilytica TaxID=439228 RepID=UPI00321F834A